MTTFNRPYATVVNLFKGVVFAFLICFASANVAAQNRTKQVTAKADRRNVARPDAMNAYKLVSLGDFFYRSNDVTDSADQYYREAIRSAPQSQAAALAQYNRGSYWFSKYYIVKEQFSKEDLGALTEAEGQFYDFIDKFARQNNTIGLLSDAHFYLALVYLQQGNRKYAIGWLNRLIGEVEDEDESVHVYKVVWSSNAADIIDRDVDAEDLAKVARQSIEKGLAFDSVVSEIKRWCKRQ